MASTDATAVPKKNQAYRLTFPIFDADGDLVTGAAGLDSEVSKDGGTFADCTNEATEIATSSGMYYLELTATEMNADTVAIIVKTSTSGAKTTPVVLYPNETGDIDVDVTAWNGTAVATPDTAGYPKITVKSGTGTGELNVASGVVDADVREWLGTAAATPTVAGVPEVDITHIAGVAASTTTAQLGVNVVQVSGDATAADNLESYTDGTTPMPVNVTQISGDATAADNVEADYDGTGYAKNNSSIATTGVVTGNVGGIDGTITDFDALAAYGDLGWAGVPALQSGTAQAGAASTITLATSASTTAQYYRGAGVIITSGTGANQDMRLITDYTTGRVATVTPDWTTNPDNTSVYQVVPAGGYVLTTGGVAIVDGGITSAKFAASAITASAIASDAITAAKIAADAIGASELAADAVTKIQSGLSTLTQANIRTAVGLASANLDTQLDALPTAAENAAALLATALSDTARTDGAAATLEQALVELMVGLGLTKIVRSGTTLTGYKFDESTTYKTWTLDSATAPTTRTSAS